jgi:hypothetical protein
MYAAFPSDGDGVYDGRGKRLVKIGVALSAGFGLGLLAFRAASVSLHGTSTSDSTDLLGMTAPRYSAIGRPSLASLPGPQAWKDLAIAGIEAHSSCERGASMKAHAEVQAAYNKMDSKSKAIIARATEATMNKAKEMPGAILPLGFWDPFGFSAKVPHGKLLFFREVELKHGRICMLASLGILVSEKFHPLAGGNIDGPAIKTLSETSLTSFWLQAAGAAALVDLAQIPNFKAWAPDTQFVKPWEEGEDTWTMKDDRVPGDFGFDPLNLKPINPDALRTVQNKELSNGRLAMLATMGMLAQELVTQKKILG